MSTLEFGLETFGDVTKGIDGHKKEQAAVLRDVLEEAQLADRLGVDVFSVGEHHRDDFAISTPETVLSAIAARTERIRVGSAVTVLSSDDPIRVFQRFSTINAISNGRAEVILGRGSFTESFPLFGYPLHQYEELFEQKLEIFAQLAKTGEVTWSGTIRPPLNEQKVYPPIEGGGSLRTLIGVGGSPESVVRAARFGFPLVLAIIGGSADRFAPFANLYRQSLAKMGSEQLPIAIHSIGHVAETDEEARNQLFPGWAESFGRIGRERGWGSTMSRAHFEQEAGPAGALYVGSPDTVAEKIVRSMSVLGASRFDMKYANGPMPHEQLMSSITLFATEVIPRVRKALES
ncbi:MAG TPA: LLM class flavin-dependent oxidoreductase [Microbacteriaceae bacterium]|nr:LLM class flavin-dependent oxidoreductase [Microbacteriaceae bacterium]